jgi:hypothetical protein
MMGSDLLKWSKHHRSCVFNTHGQSLPSWIHVHTFDMFLCHQCFVRVRRPRCCCLSLNVEEVDGWLYWPAAACYQCCHTLHVGLAVRVTGM